MIMVGSELTAGEVVPEVIESKRGSGDTVVVRM
jgi:hypothetical protein